MGCFGNEGVLIINPAPMWGPMWDPNWHS